MWPCSGGGPRYLVEESRAPASSAACVLSNVVYVLRLFFGQAHAYIPGPQDPDAKKPLCLVVHARPALLYLQGLLFFRLIYCRMFHTEYAKFQQRTRSIETCSWYRSSGMCASPDEGSEGCFLKQRIGWCPFRNARGHAPLLLLYISTYLLRCCFAASARSLCMKLSARAASSSQYGMEGVIFWAVGGSFFLESRHYYVVGYQASLDQMLNVCRQVIGVFTSVFDGVVCI